MVAMGDANLSTVKWNNEKCFFTNFLVQKFSRSSLKSYVFSKF